MESFLAVVTCFAGNYAPRYWAFCNGQTLGIAQNTALFSLLGTTYGGNGQTTFQLPNLQTRVPIGAGNGPGLPGYTIGDTGGNAAVTLNVTNLPGHVHNGNVAISMQCDAGAGSESIPEACYPAGINNAYGTTVQPGIAMKAPTYTNTIIGISGGNQPLSVMPPYLVINYIICTSGLFPSRN